MIKPSLINFEINLKKSPNINFHRLHCPNTLVSKVEVNVYKIYVSGPRREFFYSQQPNLSMYKQGVYTHGLVKKEQRNMQRFNCNIIFDFR